MTYSEIVEKYRELFVMLVEKAGRETGNTSYLKIDSILGDPKNSRIVESLVDKEPDFPVVVCSFLVALFCDIYGIDIVSGWDEDKSASKLSEFYKLYLRKATIRFCQKYGIPEFEDPETSFILVKLGGNGKTN